MVLSLWGLCTSYGVGGAVTGTVAQTKNTADVKAQITRASTKFPVNVDPNRQTGIEFAIITNPPPIFVRYEFKLSLPGRR